MCVHAYGQLPLVHSKSCLCWPLNADLWVQTAHDSSHLLGGPLSPAGEGVQMQSKHPVITLYSSLSSADSLNSPGFLSSAVPSLSPCGRSPVPSQRCFAPLGSAPDISESSAQTVQPILCVGPDSPPCSDTFLCTELWGLKVSQCLSANSSKTTANNKKTKTNCVDWNSSVVLPKHSSADEQ